MSINIKLLKALQGDCILLSYGLNLENTILIDGGMGISCQRHLQNYIKCLQNNERKIELLILTHIDNDHIDGILKLFSSNEFDFSIIKLMFFNFGKGLCNKLNITTENVVNILIPDRTSKISYRQALSLEEILHENKLSWNDMVVKFDPFKIAGAEITILSPSIEILQEFNTNFNKFESKEVKIATENDYSFSVEQLNALDFEGKVSLENKSSIAFLFEYESEKLLFLGDAPSIEIENALSEMGYSKENQIEVLCCKISHHASKHNTSNELIKMIKCHNYLISTNMTASGRPSKECLSRIICNSTQPINFYCNYKLDYKRIFSEDELDKNKVNFFTLDENGILAEDLHND